MRVLLLSTASLDTHFFKNLSFGLRKRGMEVSLASLREPGEPAWLCDIPGAKYFFLDAATKYGVPRAAWRLRNLYRQGGFHVLNAHLFDSGIVAALAKKLAPRMPVSIVRHYMDQLTFVGRPWHIAADRWAYRSADRAVTVSRVVKDYMHTVEGLPAERVQVIELGFDAAAHRGDGAAGARIRAELGLTDKFVIGNVGRLVALKGHKYLFAALAELHRSPAQAHLLLVGEGTLRAELEAEVRRLGLQEHVTFAGQQAQVPDWLRAMDVVVSASYSESFAQVVVEAMLAERPVIATRVGIAEEAIADGVTGFLVPPRDPDAIREKLERLYAAPELRARMGVAARGSAAERFVLETMVQEYFDLFQSMAADGA